MRHRAKEVDATKKWIEDFVMKNGLCPFASAGFQNDMIYYKFSQGKDLRSHLAVFWETIKQMMEGESTYYSNAFLVFSDNISFQGIMKLSNVFDEFLAQVNLDDIFQLVEFHPQLVFGDHPEEDAANFINRSPYPMIHILRKEEVKDAIESHPNISNVPLINIDNMRSIGYAKLDSLLKRYRSMS